MIFSYILITIVSSLDYQNILSKDMDYIGKQLTNGSLPEGWLSTQDVEKLLEELERVTDVVHSEQIGVSYLNHPIMAYSLCSNYLGNMSTILITSLHHSREVGSLQMNLYLFLYILWEVEHNQNPYYTHMINHNCILIVPFVNYDGYQEIQEDLIKHLYIPTTRKNVNRTDACERNQLGGVDLNRNYGYKFAYDDSGSSNDPCDETYRGSAAFSENETIAIKKLIESKNITMAMNLHCYGNLWIIPYSYDDEQIDSKSVASLIYSDYEKNGEFQGHHKFGHAKQLVGYTANGEAADWMLSQGVIAISPELGEVQYQDFMSNFYLDKSQTLKLFEKEFPPLKHFINYLPFQPTILQSYQFNQQDAKLANREFNSSFRLIEIICKNHGVSQGTTEKLIIQNHTLVEAYYRILYYEQEYRRDFDFTKLEKLTVSGNNSLQTNYFTPRSQIIYYLLIQVENTKSQEMQIYFDLYGKENNITTIKFDLNLEISTSIDQTAFQHLLYLLYISIAIIIVLAILCHKDFKKYQGQTHNITELIEQKPEQIGLNIQM